MNQPRSIQIPATPTDLVQLGDWLADMSSGVIVRDGEEVCLRAQSLSLLRALLVAPGQMASRAALESELWPAGGVGPESLNNAVARLRRELGDDPAGPAYIQTLPRRGYRLVARVASVSSGMVPHAEPVAQPARGRDLSTPLVWAGGALAALMLLLAGLGSLFQIQLVHHGDIPPEAENLYIRYDPASDD